MDGGCHLIFKDVWLNGDGIFLNIYEAALASARIDGVIQRVDGNGVNIGNYRMNYRFW